MYNSFITASKIHGGRFWLPAGTVLEITETGKIIKAHSPGTIPEEKVRHFSGILCPGFVNAHTHLELSHLKGQIPEATGLVSFVRSVVSIRDNFSEKEKQTALENALATMKRNGIVAVGDIANTTDLHGYRQKSELHFHTFVELLGFDPDKARQTFDAGMKVYRLYASEKPEGYYLRQSVVPHAPYSISKPLFDLINDFGEKQLLSIHNQETKAEHDWFLDKTGDFPSFFEVLGFPFEKFQASGKSSLQTFLPWLNKVGQLLLVHDTCTEKADLAFLEKQRSPKIFFCLCSKANWYIERKVPPVEMLRAFTQEICIGTDSLSSNDELNILGEIQHLRKQLPELPFVDLLRWATWNGARALGMEDAVGSLTVGKQPGIVHLENENSCRCTVLYPAGKTGV